MEITQVKSNDLTAEIHVHLTPEDYKQKVNEEIKRQSRNVSVPGFRAGKVPFNLVRKMLGISVVMEQVNKLVSHDLVHYIQDNKLDILGEPISKDMKSEEDFDLECTKELDFHFEIGLAPTVDIDWDGIKLPPMYKIKADDEFLDKEIEGYLDRFGDVTNPEEVKEGDIFYGRGYEVDESGEAIEGGFDRMLAFNPERVKNEEVLKPYIDMKIGETKDLNLLSVADSHKEIAELFFMDEEEVAALEGKALKFELKKVNRVSKAEMNKAFFEKVGNAYGWDNAAEVEDETAFKQILSDKMEEELVESARYQFRNDLQKVIMESIKIDLPDEFLKKWLKRSKDFTDERLDDEYESFSDSVRWSLVMEKLKTEGDVKVEEEDLKAAVRKSLERTLMQSGMPADPAMMEQYMEYAMQNQEMVEGEYQKLLNEKVYDYLESKLSPKNKSITATKFVEMLDKERAK